MTLNLKPDSLQKALDYGDDVGSRASCSWYLALTYTSHQETSSSCHQAHHWQHRRCAGVQGHHHWASCCLMHFDFPHLAIYCFMLGFRRILGICWSWILCPSLDSSWKSPVLLGSQVAQEIHISKAVSLKSGVWVCFLCSHFEAGQADTHLAFSFGFWGNLGSLIWFSQEFVRIFACVRSQPNLYLACNCLPCVFL